MIFPIKKIRQFNVESWRLGNEDDPNGHADGPNGSDGGVFTLAVIEMYPPHDQG